MNKFIFNDVFDPQNINSVLEESGSDNPYYKKIKLIESEFTDLVEVMRKEKWIPNSSINVLMNLFFNLVGNKITPVGITTSVETLGFWCEIRGSKSFASILVPENWHDILVKDTYMQMGALVFAASQAKDYWNHKFHNYSKKEIHDRAHSFESELLQYFSRTSSKFKANPYQQHILDRYPEGIASVDSHYDGRMYDGVFPPYPVEY